MKREPSVVTPKMAGLQRIEVIREYCDYVAEHLHNVVKAWVILQKALPGEKVMWNDFDYWITHGMIEQHDLSKMGVEEFIPSADWYFEPYGKEWESMVVEQEDQHRSAMKAYEAALYHHYANNPHHWQNWTQGVEHFPGESCCHLVCMVADWMAMGMKFGDTAEEFYRRKKGTMNLPEWAVEFLERIFFALREYDRGGNKKKWIQVGKKDPASAPSGNFAGTRKEGEG